MSNQTDNFLSIDNNRVEDVVAGGILLIIGLLGLFSYAIVIWAMAMLSSDIVGFRFLFSQAIADLLLLLQFSIWPSIVIISQNRLIPDQYRWHVHMYLDFTWWTVVYHYPIVGWSRLAAIQWPNWFRCLPTTSCILICTSAWFIGLMQTIIEHQFEWFESLYFDPKLYGLVADWKRYGESGTRNYYLTFNIISMIAPFPFYGIALFVLFRRRQRRPSLEPNPHLRRHRASSIMPTSILIQQRQLSIETRLLIPCIINTLLFVIGQLVINLASSVFDGKWLTWLLMVVFASNSFVNPILYLSFSSVMRRYILRSFERQRRLSMIINNEVIRCTNNNDDYDDDRRSSSQTNAMQSSSTIVNNHQRSSLLKDTRSNTLLILSFSSSN